MTRAVETNTTPTTNTRSRRGTSELHDDALLDRFRDGDKDAFTLLLERHDRSALRFAERLIPGARRDDSAEIVAEAVSRVLGALRRGTGPSTGFRPYLFTTIRSVVATRMRRPRFETVPLDALPTEDALVRPTLDHWIDQWIEDHAVRAAYRSLPERWRQVLWVTVVDDIPPREAAVLFGLSPNALSALAVRARAGLRSAYEEQADRSATTTP